MCGQSHELPQVTESVSLVVERSVTLQHIFLCRLICLHCMLPAISLHVGTAQIAAPGTGTVTFNIPLLISRPVGTVGLTNLANYTTTGDPSADSTAWPGSFCCSTLHRQISSGPFRFLLVSSTHSEAIDFSSATSLSLHRNLRCLLLLRKRNEICFLTTCVRTCAGFDLGAVVNKQFNATQPFTAQAHGTFTYLPGQYIQVGGNVEQWIFVNGIKVFPHPSPTCAGPCVMHAGYPCCSSVLPPIHLDVI